MGRKNMEQNFTRKNNRGENPLKEDMGKPTDE
jgi:hypothetical protein